MKLVPVLELEPASFQNQNYPYPNGSSQEMPEEWYIYWKKSLADSGITDLEPYEKGCWFVPISQIINSKDILPIFTVLLQDFDYRGNISIAEEYSSLAGGFILELENQETIYPQCCGKLEDIYEWKQAIGTKNPVEEMLWIGHPWLMVKSLDEGNIQLRQTIEYEELDKPKIKKIDRYELSQALESAEQILAEFKQKIRQILPNILSSHASSSDLEIIANILIYGCTQENLI